MVLRQLVLSGLLNIALLAMGPWVGLTMARGKGHGGAGVIYLVTGTKRYRERRVMCENKTEKP